jgi:hypothetical protein
MNKKAVSTLAASLLLLCVSTLAAGPLQAQGKAEGGPGTPPPKAQGRGDVAPAPQRPEPQPRVPERESQSERDEAPGLQHGCPDQGRPLELIV